MSRTHKDIPYKFSFPEEARYFRYFPGYPFLKRPGVKTKKRKEVDTKHHWMSTPSWWTRMFMIRPRRHSENRQLRMLRNIDEFDFVDNKRKPHKYYY